VDRRPEEVVVNQELAELKARLRKIEESLAGAGGGVAARIGLAQAVSRARRLLRREDRTRAPSAAFRASIEQAEHVASSSGHDSP
jgi:hypothetical protein